MRAAFFLATSIHRMNEDGNGRVVDCGRARLLECTVALDSCSLQLFCLAFPPLFLAFPK